MAGSGVQHPPIQAPLGDVTTARLELRRFRSEDLDALAVLFEKKEVWKFPYGRGFTREERAAFLNTQLKEWDSCVAGLLYEMSRAEWLERA
jgi:RimJ/RimL family protein N-acetyltransferase